MTVRTEIDVTPATDARTEGGLAGCGRMVLHGDYTSLCSGRLEWFIL